jgi:signal peptidase II
MSFKKNSLWILTLFLITIEQGIKLLINKYFLEANIPILPPILYFNPMFNRDYSWINSMLQIGVGKWLHILMVLVVLMIVFILYKFLNTKIKMTLFINMTFAFLFSAAICSLIDKVFWDGSLDYIMVSGFFTFDLKDVYINICIGFVIIMIIMDYKGIRNSDEKALLNEIIQFLKRKKE